MPALFVALSRYCLIFATAGALVAVGFAHRTLPSAPSPELAAYIAAGGAIGDICGTTDGDGPVSTVDCEACRISDTTSLLNGHCPSAFQNTLKTTVLGRIAKRLAESRSLAPARLVRAPPQA